MAVLQVIQSGSSGNAYLVKTALGNVLLECGVPWASVLSALDYNIKDLVAVLCTHAHNDHAQYLQQVRGRTMCNNIWSTPEVAAEYGVNALQPKTKYTLGGVGIVALPVPHSTECYAYAIDLPCGEGRLLFATDCGDFPYNVKGVNYMLIEANWDRDIVLERHFEGEGSNASTIGAHLELEKTLEIVERHRSSMLREVILCHMSARNINADKCITTFQKRAGITPKIARSGLKVELSLDDF